MNHNLTLQSWQTLIEHETTLAEFDILVTKAIVKSETSLGVRYLLISKFGDEQKLQVTSKKPFLVKRKYEALEIFDY